MSSASALRRQIEASLANRIPSALTPVARAVKPVASTGISTVDELLDGGLPLGAITEIVGPECSGKTSFALSFLRGITCEGKVCAWVDIADTFHPESAAAAGIYLPALLWIRCGVTASAEEASSIAESFALPEKYFVPPPTRKGLHGGGCGGHPRNEVKGLSKAVGQFLQPSITEPFQPNLGQRRDLLPRSISAIPSAETQRISGLAVSRQPWSSIEQALRVTDLLLQAGGFSAIVLDMGCIAPEFALRVPLATWFRYRAAAERSQASILLLSQQSCAKSSVGLLLSLHAGTAMTEEATVLAGVEHRVTVQRERFKGAPTNVIPLRKPPQRATETAWQSRTIWTGAR